MRVKPEARTFVALDTPDRERALVLGRTLAGRVGGVKIGLEAFVACGPSLIDAMRDLGHAVFLDLKFHDIPNTVSGAAAAAARTGVGLFTVHALGGPAMVGAAVAASRKAASPGTEPPVVLAVTILTSHDDASLRRIGIDGTCADAVPRLAAIAREAGAGGVVCSPLEVAAARRAFPDGLLVVPGIRPATSEPRTPDDQARVSTPAAAVRAGADLIVVGRPITEASDPAAAAAAIADDILRNAGVQSRP
jgi:orotidine-5'-phosphate decarboxylase